MNGEIHGGVGNFMDGKCSGTCPDGEGPEGGGGAGGKPQGVELPDTIHNI